MSRCLCPTIVMSFGVLIASTAIVAEAAEPAAVPPAATEAAKPTPAAAIAPTPAVASSELTLLALPGAPADGVMLDYLTVDRGRNRVWVPAGGTGNAVVIDTKTKDVRTVEKFATKEVERRGQKRMVGLSSATVGDGVVYVGNRADSSICAVDAKTLERRDCVTLTGSPDGLAYIARTKEVWVTTPHDQAIVVLDVSKPGTPKVSGTFKLEGDPEGYAVDDVHGLFYTNLEDKDRTLKIDVATRKVTATWMPACGEDGPKGLAIEPKGQLLMVACPEHVEVLDAGKDGAILSKLDTGEGVDNIDYLPAKRALYVAAGRAAKLTVARIDEKGVLQSAAMVTTATGARNAVVSEDGTAYVADGREGKILVVRPAHGI
ncbi:MAG TPA: YncE family protein [Candidatus Polarisedimenticolaceae bacterium]|nr:YncE family protein [Candidatus Polarisedimenticolaceae bacterium]